MPRIFGYAFNPLSVYFCHRARRRPGGDIYEVNNTFGQRHTYLIPVDGPPAARDPPAAATRAFYVSPFMDMAMTYASASPPG